MSPFVVADDVSRGAGYGDELASYPSFLFSSPPTADSRDAIDEGRGSARIRAGREAGLSYSGGSSRRNKQTRHVSFREEVVSKWCGEETLEETGSNWSKQQSFPPNRRQKWSRRKTTKISSDGSSTRSKKKRNLSKARGRHIALSYGSRRNRHFFDCEKPRGSLAGDERSLAASEVSRDDGILFDSMFVTCGDVVGHVVAEGTRAHAILDAGYDAFEVDQKNFRQIEEAAGEVDFGLCGVDDATAKLTLHGNLEESWDEEILAPPTISHKQTEWKLLHARNGCGLDGDNSASIISPTVSTYRSQMTEWKLLQTLDGAYVDNNNSLVMVGMGTRELRTSPEEPTTRLEEDTPAPVVSATDSTKKEVNESIEVSIETFGKETSSYDDSVRKGKRGKNDELAKAEKSPIWGSKGAMKKILMTAKNAESKTRNWIRKNAEAKRSRTGFASYDSAANAFQGQPQARYEQVAVIDTAESVELLLGVSQ